MPDSWIRSAVAEGIGTFALCFVGILIVGQELGTTPGGVGQGLVILVFVAAFGHISGGHINPAVTLGLLLAKKIDVIAAAVYWAAQMLGGVLAALVVWLATGERELIAAGTPTINVVSVGGAILLEAIATFFLVLVVFATVVDDRAPASVYPFAIGLTVTIGVFALGPLTGGALNPARGFGPALVGGEWGGAAAWFVGPLLGGILAWAVYTYVISPGPQSGKDTFPQPVPPPDPLVR